MNSSEPSLRARIYDAITSGATFAEVARDLGLSFGNVKTEYDAAATRLRLGAVGPFADRLGTRELYALYNAFGRFPAPAEVAAMSFKEIASAPNFGLRSFQRLRDALSEFGLDFKDVPDRLNVGQFKPFDRG